MVYLIKWQGSVHIEYKYISLHLKATKLLGFFCPKDFIHPQSHQEHLYDYKLNSSQDKSL